MAYVSDVTVSPTVRLSGLQCWWVCLPAAVASEVYMCGLVVLFKMMC